MRAGRAARASRVQFVLNYEEGGENSRAARRRRQRAVPVRDVQPAGLRGAPPDMECIYEYGSRVGVWRLLREFERRGLPLTVFGVAMALERYPEVTRGLRRAAATRSPATAGAGSTTRTSTRRPSASTCARGMADHRAAHRRQRPLGWYTGRDSPNTRRLVADYGGFEYDSDYYGDDLPFWLQVQQDRRHAGAAPGRAVHARQPTTCASRCRRASRTGDDFFDYLRDSFDVLYAEGARDGRR